MATTTTAQRFWAKVDIRSDDECWPWTASLNGRGYGQFYLDGRRRKAHQVAWEMANGPIPAGKDIDHQCHNADEACAGGVTCPHRSCVNPRHTTPRSRRANLLAGRTIVAAAARQTECANHHPLSGPGADVRLGGASGTQRRCRPCERLKAQRGRERRRIAA